MSSDEVTLLEGGEELFLRTDLPGHIKHAKGDTFSEVYLSYQGHVPFSEFGEDFAPQAKFRYRRPADESQIPERMIRAYRTRDAKTGELLGAMAEAVSDATGLCDLAMTLEETED